MEKVRELSARLRAESEALAAAESRLLMHVNRANSAWVESQEWEAPDIWGEEELFTWSRSTAAEKYRADTVERLKAGQVAVLFNTFEDYVEVPSWSADGGGSTMMNLWCSDPWQLLAASRPGAFEASMQSQGGARAYLSYGGRVLAALVAGVHAALGHGSEAAQAAVAAMHVILAVDDEMQAEVAKDVWAHHFYGCVWGCG